MMVVIESSVARLGGRFDLRQSQGFVFVGAPLPIYCKRLERPAVHDALEAGKPHCQ